MNADLSVRNPTSAQRRAGDALLRCLGGRTVFLRLPTLATSGSDAEQLGEATPGYEDIALSPAAFRKVRAELRDGEANRYEILVSASSVLTQLGLLQLSSTSDLFGMASGIFVDGELMPIEAVAQAEAFGRPYLYRLIVRGPESHSL